MKRLCTPYTACTRRNIAREREREWQETKCTKKKKKKMANRFYTEKCRTATIQLCVVPALSLYLFLSREIYTENRPTKLTVWICFFIDWSVAERISPYCVYCEMFIVRNGILTRFRRIEPTVRHRAQLLLYFTDDDEQKWKRERKTSKNWTFLSRATQMSGWLTPFICLNSSAMYNVCTE